MSEHDEALREEFLAEAAEIVEALSRDLLALDQAQREGRDEPGLVHEIFRGVHTLKGLAHVFGHHKMGALAHALEDLLDDLRLGRIALGQSVLDVLFEGVEHFQRLLGNAERPVEAASEGDLARYAERLERFAPAVPPAARAPAEVYELDEQTLGVLTEYEEHRLRTNVEQGVPLYRLDGSFALASIDTSLEELKQRLKSLGEVITILPRSGGGPPDVIELTLLFASRAPVERIAEAAGAQVLVAPVPRREERPTRPPTRAESPGGGTAAEVAGRRPTIVPAPDPEARPATHERPAGPAERSPSDAPAAPLDREGVETGRGAAHTVRVDIRKLDHLLNVVGELSLVRAALGRIEERLRGEPSLRALALELQRARRGLDRNLDEMQDGILSVRMVPLRQVFDRLARVVRQVAREHEKQVRLVVTGAETEVDKLIVEELTDPLMHIVRNAIDHGIERPTLRELAGKPTVGTVAINAYQKGSHVVIEIEDDGAGMNADKIFETAVRRGLVDRSSRDELSPHEILQLVFLPGFTTRSAITDTSGRGVGLDVVKTNIARLGGVVDVSSEPGVGTKLTLTLPVTLAIVRALLVRVGAQSFCLPLSAVEEALAFDPAAVRRIDGHEVVSVRGSTLPICRLGRLFGIAATLPPDPRSRRRGFVVIVALGQRRLGLVVDDLGGQRDVVIKPLGPSLRAVRGFAGATDLGEQRVALVLDAPGLLEEVLGGVDRPVSLARAPS
ncbi:MAG: chemotaxis protein CheA [Myxococcales bacterium]|nr:chemotaxis protein CheA [Myxococcales bacterium]